MTREQIQQALADIELSDGCTIDHEEFTTCERYEIGSTAQLRLRASALDIAQRYEADQQLIAQLVGALQDTLALIGRVGERTPIYESDGQIFRGEQALAAAQQREGKL